MEKPENLRNIMVTYRKKFYTGAYGDTVETKIVTKMGFYDEIFDYISVPPSWRNFNGVLLPHGFGGDRLQVRDVIKWEYCD